MLAGSRCSALYPLVMVEMSPTELISTTSGGKELSITPSPSLSIAKIALIVLCETPSRRRSRHLPLQASLTAPQRRERASGLRRLDSSTQP